MSFNAIVFVLVTGEFTEDDHLFGEAIPGAQLLHHPNVLALEVNDTLVKAGITSAHLSLEICIHRVSALHINI